MNFNARTFGLFAGLMLAYALLLASCTSDASSDRTTGDASGTQPMGERPTPTPSLLRRATMIENPADLRIGERFSIPSVSKVDDTPFSALELAKSHRAIVFAMTSAGCPLSTMYAPRLAALEAEYAAKRVAFVHVNVVGAESREEMRQFIREHRFRGAYIPDKDHVLATVLSPRTTTEVFVFDPTFTLMYRGAIDDQYGVGTALDTPRKLFLRDALDSFLAGESPKVAATWAPGCLVDSRTKVDNASTISPVAVGGTPLTYMGRISKIIDAHCVECHRPFGVAPFSLAGPQDITGRARMIEAVVREGLMPPGHGVTTPTGQSTPWVNPREMSKDEQADLIAWLNSDRPVGEIQQAPLPLDRPRGWAMGSPDLLLTAGPIELPVDGAMQYHRAVVPTNLTADRWASVIECRPMRQNGIHHALVWLLPPGARVPSIDDNPTDLELLFSYSPGQDVVRYDAGIARRIPAGSMLLVDLYARPMGRLMNESLRIGLKTTASPPTREVRTMMISADSLRILPGDARGINRASVALPNDTTLLSLTGYMRRLGAAFTLSATSRSGATEVLLQSPRYDYRWQVRHEYIEPRLLPTGSILTLEGVHDNSESNRNLADTTHRVPTGPKPAAEAIFMAIEVLRDVPAAKEPANQ